MRWRKHGRIFDPTQHRLPNGCTQFAQSPQALVFDDFVRVYFSCRSVDGANGKYLSHVAFVDFAKDLRRILRVSDRAVVNLGALGCFDEHGIFPMNVIRHGDLVYGYTTGWSRRQSVSVETAIGLVISRDGGITFERFGDGPVLGSSLHEPFLVGDAFVASLEGKLHMWYIFGTRWQRFPSSGLPERTYKIGHATSSDGKDWVKQEAVQVVPDVLGEHESQALPTVCKVDAAYHMFFCYRHSDDFRRNSDRGYRIGHARSQDLLQWVRDDSVLSLQGTPGDWDGDMQCYPHVFECDSEIYLLYNGNEFGRYGFGLAQLQR
ncbi:MAG: hypothetical protein HS128_16515 [Ideonella sp.]|nr:hypothetical protein [Ideonella sp.]MCC7456898.1 hypothetical protein [Nitrospira sp.]